MDIKHGNGKFSDLFLCLTFSLCFLKGCVAFLIGVGRELAILGKANSSKRSVSKHPYLLVDFIAPCVCSLLTFLNIFFSKYWAECYHTRHLLVQSHKWKRQNYAWNLFKFNNEDIRTTKMTSFWCINCSVWTDFVHCFFSY